MEIFTELKSLYDLIKEHLGVLLSFLLGATFTIAFTKIQRKRQSTNLRKLYLMWFNLSKNNILNQLSLIKSYVDEIKKGTLGSSILKLNILRIEVLLTFEYEKLFEAFVYDRRGNQDENAKQIFQLTGNVQYLVISVEAIKSKFEKSQDHYQDWQSRFNKDLIDFNELIFNYFTQYRKNMGAFLEGITEIKINFKEKYSINPPTDKVISELVKPIENIIHDHLVYESDSKILKDIKRKCQDV
ncbi:hypothetical protein MM213_17510 [Belliella sp. R4-6]|uniref:Uncharacterized protein n=1 Tax=Belliella alkalica TaxID=1730871 RepID=A0ABS9VFT9_9BACT|nr:hypothetical protein [Belliella alkalica]MCH7415302.1 hypothetical protein [Belliella alkalica]